MKAEREELLQVLDRFPGTPMLVIGDLILDHYIWGRVNRISPEAPVVVVQVTEESKRPGGAGNVAHNLATLGAAVSIFGVIGDDQSGRELVRAMEENKVNTQGVMFDRARPTTVKTRVIAHAQQVVRVDRENTSAIGNALSEGLAAAVCAKIPEVRGAIVSDYGKGTINANLFSRLSALKDQGVLGFGKVPLLVDPKAPNFSMYRGATVIKPNRREAEEAATTSIRDRASAIQAGADLLKKWGCEMLLITLGEEGMVLVSEGAKAAEKAIEIDTVAREVYDVSGAGDTVSAVFTLALGVGATPRQAARLANFAAGIVVAEVGTVAVSLEELRTAVAEDV